ncbi:hypothetical protein M1403_03850 [Patescibacteria group bacterium]|nr:hypothetical protein [Patescibacteria group bacterium]
MASKSPEIPNDHATKIVTWEKDKNLEILKALEKRSAEEPAAGEVIKLLWLASYYQSLKSLGIYETDYGVVVHCVRDYVKREKGMVRYRPTARQVLGKSRELKRKAFGDHLEELFSPSKPQTAISRYRPHSFINGSKDRRIIPLKDMRVRLLTVDWGDVVKLARHGQNGDRIRLDLERNFSDWYRRPDNEEDKEDLPF